MPYRKSKIYASRKPASGTLVDWGHPLSAGLVLSLILNESGGNSPVNGAFPEPVSIQGSNIVWGVGSFGPALQHSLTDTASYVQFSASRYDFERTDRFSVEAWVYFTDGTAATGRNLFVGNDSATSPFPGFFIDLNNTSDNDVRLVLRNSSINNAIDIITAGSITKTSFWNHVIATYDGSSTAAGLKGYVNGVLRTFSVTADNLTASSKSGLNWCLGRTGNITSVGGKSGTRYGLHRVWKRELKSSEVRQLFENPFGNMVAPRRRIISQVAVTSTVDQWYNQTSIPKREPFEAVPY